MLPFFKKKPEDNAAPDVPKESWLTRMRAGLNKSSAQITDGITKIFTTRKLDQAMLDELEELLIMADLGPDLAAELVRDFGKEKFGKDIAPDEVKTELASRIATILSRVAVPIPQPIAAPHVVLVVGVNGAGKTTTIAKLAERWIGEGKKVMCAAGDTFRAAAIEQLKIWGARTGAAVIAKDHGADSAALAFEALEAARKAGADVLLIDTAGRLQNRTDLMAELEKIVRVLRKQDDAVPHQTLLVLDATVGQNAIQQAKVFKEMVNVTGLIVTKLDGTAKAGVVVALARQFGLPIHAIGVGEGAADLQPFDAQAFASSLVGVVSPDIV